MIKNHDKYYEVKLKNFQIMDDINKFKTVRFFEDDGDNLKKSRRG